MWCRYHRFRIYPSCWKKELTGVLGPIKWQKSLLPRCIRSICSETGKWEDTYASETIKKVESWWHSRVKDQFHKTIEIDVRIMAAFNFLSCSPLNAFICFWKYWPVSYSILTCWQNSVEAATIVWWTVSCVHLLDCSHSSFNPPSWPLEALGSSCCIFCLG